MSTTVSSSPIGQATSQPPPAPVQPVQAAGDLPDVRGVAAASDTATLHDDAADRQRRAVAAVRDALAKSNGITLPHNTKLVVIADKESGRYVYEFQDPATGEIIVQYPDKHVLAVLAAANVAAQGALVSRKV